MKITSEQLNSIGLHSTQKTPHLFSDFEDMCFNNRTNELFYVNCVDGSTELYRKVTDFEDLKQAIYDGFGVDCDSM